MSPVPGFPSMKAKKMRALLRAQGYLAVPGRGRGSHTVLECPGRPQILFAFHDKDNIGPVMVRKILMQAGYSAEEAKELVKDA